MPRGFKSNNTGNLHISFSLLASNFRGGGNRDGEKRWEWDRDIYYSVIV